MAPTRSARLDQAPASERRTSACRFSSALKLAAVAALAISCGKRPKRSFSLESGLRAANVTGLRWSSVDLDHKSAWVHPDEAKARKAIPVP